MTWFYFCIAVFLFVSGIVILVKPDFLKIIMQFILDKDIFYLPGVIEIAISLGTLYYRDQTRMTWFVYIVGLALFIDGIFYLLASKRIREMYTWFIGIAEPKVRSYGLFTLLLAVGYGLAAIA